MNSFILNIIVLFSFVLYSCQTNKIRVKNNSNDVVDSITIDLNFKRIALFTDVAPKFDNLVIYSSDSFNLRHDVVLQIALYKNGIVKDAYSGFNDLGHVSSAMTVEIIDSLKLIYSPTISN